MKEWRISQKSVGGGGLDLKPLPNLLCVSLAVLLVAKLVRSRLEPVMSFGNGRFRVGLRGTYLPYCDALLIRQTPRQTRGWLEFK
jgi:hypothetical protein